MARMFVLLVGLGALKELAVGMAQGHSALPRP